MSDRPDDDRIRRLLDVGRSLVAELDPEVVLERILEEARQITGARYAALGVMDEQRTELERFLTTGIDAATHRAIGDLPHGRGVLGVLIEDPQPLRLANVGQHPQSYGFPPGHPPMRTFLGVPVLIRGEAWGNLYLTDKEGGEEFTGADEEAAIILSEWAATAIENARLHEWSEQRRGQAERAVRGLEAARDIADAIASVGDLDRVLELIVKRGRALIDAQSLLIMLREGDELVVAASAGHAAGARGHRVPVSGSTSGQVLARGRPERIKDVSTRLRIAPQELGVAEAKTALIVPMLHHGQGIGVLAAFDRGQLGGEFTPADEQLLRTFAASAANAVAIKRSVETDRLRSAIAAADAERGRFARELHDETLQALGGLRVGLASAVRRQDSVVWERAMRQAIEDIEEGIENLRAIISDLRPSLLDDLGLLPAVEALLDRRRERGLEIIGRLNLPAPASGTKLAPELETTVYRFIQEALTNVIKHARATTVRVSAQLVDDRLVLEVQDDGAGFDPSAQSTGFGLAGMRERVYLAGGTLDVQSGEDGTVLRAELPANAAAGASSRSVADQVAS